MFKEGNLDFSKIENQKILEKKLDQITAEEKQAFMHEKLGEAKDFELETLFEKSETICVSIEKLIPGIKNKLESIESYKAKTIGNNLPDRYSEDLAPIIYRDYRDLLNLHSISLESDGVPATEDEIEERNKKAAELTSLKDQVVIDLGSTDMPYHAYTIASLFGAKGFVGVDAYDSPVSFFNKNKVEAAELINHEFERYNSEDLKELGIKPIPGVGIREDMLSFLKRLPDNSVSIITSGIDSYVLDVFDGDKSGLVSEIENEIQRVLSDKGVYLSFNSAFQPSELVDKMKDASTYSKSEGLYIFKKKWK